MIEIVGDFDLGRDVLDGAQRQSVVAVVACLMHTFDVPAAAIRFHRELGSPKTCPGSGVDKEELLDEIVQALAATSAPSKPAARARGARSAPFGSRHWLGYEVTLPAAALPSGFETQEVSEDPLMADRISAATRLRVDTAGGGRDLARSLDRMQKWDALRPYVINLSKGRLSQHGEFEMPDGSIETIVESIARYAASSEQPRLMLHAHGGLVAERAALEYARAAHGWWLEHGVYPLYFVWETGVLDILKQQLLGARGLLGDARDYIFEATARTLGGKIIWGNMKESARLASSLDAGDGEAGGARIFAAAVAPLIASSRATRPISVHAVGHSAGAIFHAHLLPVLLELGVSIETLALLAPAVRHDLFEQMLLDSIREQRIGSFTMYTMDEEAERDDDCVEPLGVTLYGKSLLYLVSRAFEPKRKTPILGLEEMLCDDAKIKDLFTRPNTRLELAHARGKPPNAATQALAHGAFDNDPATMASVLNGIAHLTPRTPFPGVGGARRGTRALPSLPILGVPMQAAAPLQTGNVATRGTRRALCVGIDHYRDSPLAGCVRDAQAWSRVLSELSFEVHSLFDAAATRHAVLDALRSLIESAQPGELLVFQYSGHGTQVQDLNGDEADRYDEALVPVDYHTGALLLDDDLAELYRRIPAGVVLTLFMDCCHSGTNSRFAPLDRGAARGSERRRFMVLPAEVQEAHRRFRAHHGSPAPTTAEESLPGVIHFAACLDNQYAYESDGQGHFTKVTTTELAQAVKGGVTNEAFAMDIAAKVSALQRPQTPRLMRLPATLCERPVLGAASSEQQQEC